MAFHQRSSRMQVKCKRGLNRRRPRVTANGSHFASIAQYPPSLVALHTPALKKTTLNTDREQGTSHCFRDIFFMVVSGDPALEINRFRPTPGVSECSWVFKSTACFTIDQMALDGTQLWGISWLAISCTPENAEVIAVVC